MSDFSHIGVDANFALFPEPARGRNYQSKDLPEDNGKSVCVDGDVRADGMFVRQDGQLDLSLNGWIRLISDFGPWEFSILFQDGRAIEVITGRRLPTGAVLANHWPVNGV